MSVLGSILGIEAIRRRVGFELQQSYYHELGIAVPIGQRLHCPLVNRDYWWSFEEVFLTEEYRPVFDLIPPPARWLDFGCHAGFFSLLTVLARRKRGLAEDFAALLVDGDSRVQASVEAIGARNSFGDRFRFAHGAVAAKGEEVFFEEAEVMSSSIVTGETPRGRRVPVINAQDVMKRLAPPYDLIKVDVEGAEFDFLQAYGPLLSGARHLLIEWHSWHFGGGGLPTIRAAAGAAGFREVAELAPAHVVANDPTKTCGVLLWERNK